MTRGAVLTVVGRCRLCRVQLAPEDDARRGLCSSCVVRPEAKRLGPLEAGLPSARAFTIAETSLIAKLQSYMPTAQLLALLNERLVADLGPDAAPYTLEQLQVQIGETAEAQSAIDWTGLRRLIASARRAGVLDQITTTVIDDFAAVFLLTPAQVTQLKDVFARTQEAL